MPLYLIQSKTKFSKEKKDKTVAAITEIHCRVTGAPAKFVNVIFMTGYRLKNNKKAILLGNIRTGGTRTEEVVIQLKRELHEGIAANLELPIQKVGYQFLGVYPYWVWEGGKVLPMPGDEDDWLKTKPA